MRTINYFLQERLQYRADNGSLRNLSTTSNPIDFCSNDYLGMARSTELQAEIIREISVFPQYKNGSGGSRLLSGNHLYTEQTEQFIADFHGAESGLIFNSGYDANVGLLSCLPQRNDTIITDEWVHASVIDGARLSYASRYSFRHNDLDSLESKLKIAKGTIFVLVESVYSMDGDIAPLNKINDLCKQYNAHLIVDEAHATGIFGSQGRGIINLLGLEKDVFARIVTFGKALGCHGAIILGSNMLRNYLINFARSFIYTTAAPIHSIIAVKCAYRELIKNDYPPVIAERITYFNHLVADRSVQCIPSMSTIQGVVFNSNESTKEAARLLQARGFDVRAILSPTVPKGRERLRICLHTFNTNEEIAQLVDELCKL